jgi:cell division protein FtsB
MFTKLKKNYFLLITIFLFLYFFFNFLGGERGLFSYIEKKNLLTDLQKKEIYLNNKIKNIEFKNSLLTNNLDLDYIEILLRQKFLLGKKDEKFYIIEKHDN